MPEASFIPISSFQTKHAFIVGAHKRDRLASVHVLFCLFATSTIIHIRWSPSTQTQDGKHRFVHPLSSADMTVKSLSYIREGGGGRGGQPKTPKEEGTSQNKQTKGKKNQQIQLRTNISANLKQFKRRASAVTAGFVRSRWERSARRSRVHREGGGHRTNTSKSPEDKPPPTVNQSSIFRL